MLFLAFVALAAAVPDFCPYRLVSDPGAALICGLRGTLSKPAVLETRSVADLPACQTACAGVKSCRGFSFNGGTCTTYSAKLRKQGWKKGTGAVFYSKGCFVLNPSCSSTSTTSDASQTTGQVDPESPTSASPTGPPPIISTPVDLPGGSPADPSQFQATYTYYEQALPTFTDNGTVSDGLPTELPEVPECIPDGGPFNLIHQKLGYLLNLPTTLGFLPTPKTQEEADAMQNFQPPEFTLSGSDLIVNGKFVARTGKGQTLLTDKPAPSWIMRNGQRIITSIFKITCDGQLAVEVDGNTESLNDASGKLKFGAVQSYIIVVPLNTLAKRSMSMAKRSATSGVAPRCANFPPNLKAVTKAGARPPQANGCGGDTTANWVPDFSFGKCCDKHDYDFDDCSKDFETANSEFRQCMRGSGCDYLNNFLTYPFYLACLGTADAYYLAVSLKGGQEAFDKANKARCTCVCGDDEQRLCGGPQCRTISNGDINNCGACDRKCPSRTHCSGAFCVCDDQTCGNSCVSILSHPNHCGRCGNVCPSGYCFQGACYEPPKDVCAPRNTIANPSFVGSMDPWGSFGDSPLQLTPPIPGVTCMLGGVGRYVRFAQNVFFCENTQYELTFDFNIVFVSSSYANLRLVVEIGSYRVYNDLFDWRTTSGRIPILRLPVNSGLEKSGLGVSAPLSILFGYEAGDSPAFYFRLSNVALLAS